MRFDNLTSAEILEICRRVEEDMRAERAGKPPRKRFFDDWPGAQFTDDFVTILVIAALLFSFRGLDNMPGEFGRNSGVLQK